MSEQRDLMRELWRHHGVDRDLVVAAHAAAEERGEVPRKSNSHGWSPTSYAQALLRDGLRKG